MKLTNWKLIYKEAKNLTEKVDVIAKMLGVWEEPKIPIPVIDYTDPAIPLPAIPDPEREKEHDPDYPPLTESDLIGSE